MDEVNGGTLAVEFRDRIARLTAVALRDERVQLARSSAGCGAPGYKQRQSISPLCTDRFRQEMRRVYRKVRSRLRCDLALFGRNNSRHEPIYSLVLRDRSGRYS